MAQVTVSVNGRDYAVGCDEGQEGHVAYLAEFIDQRVRELAASVGQVSESRLLLLAALMIADDLATAYDKLEQGPGAQAGANGGGDGAGLGDLAARLERIAGRLETA